MWTQALTNWSLNGVEFSGLWLDMNEVSSFCVGSWYVAVWSFQFYISPQFGYHSGTGANLSDMSVPFALPGQPGNLVVDYPEG